MAPILQRQTRVAKADRTVSPEQDRVSRPWVVCTAPLPVKEVRSRLVTGSRRTLPASTLGAAAADGGTLTHGLLLLVELTGEKERPRCRRAIGRTRRSSGSASSTWCGKGARSRSWGASLSPRHRRFETGSSAER